jgi:tetratricopeptide (TPR) repeat protein
LQDTQKIFDIAVTHHQTGRFADAETLYRKVLTLDPQHADSLHLLGVMAYQFRRLELAAGLISQAVRIRDDVPAYHNNLGNVFKEQERLDDAVACYERAISLKPDIAEIYNNLAAIYIRQGRLYEATLSCQRAIGLNSAFAEAHSNLGAIYFEQGDIEKAVVCWKTSIALKPAFADAHSNLGKALQEQGKLNEAIVCYKQVVMLKPTSAEAYNNLGRLYEEQGNPKEAASCFERAITLKPDYADAYNNLGAIHYDQGRSEDAVSCFQRALELNPSRAETHSNLGNILKNEGKLDEAIARYECAIAHNPAYAEAHLNEAFARLLIGDFAAGWRKNEWRWMIKKHRPRDLNAPLWDGTDLHGKTILLHCEQGLGDNIQFVRYASMVKEKGGQVLLLCPPELASLFERVVGPNQILTSIVRPFDCQTPLLSLPGLFGTTLNTIPAKVPYLHPNEELVKFWRSRLARLNGYKVGVVWRGNPTHKNDRNRSMTSAQFAQFLDLPGISVVSLQKDATEEEVKGLKIDAHGLNCGPELKDFSDTAALVCSVDLVITVDTSVCHLAGAVGVPVWTLLPFAPDWRWLLKRTDSPWYPTMRLFRQPKIGDWQSVLQLVRIELSQIVSTSA